jgi:glycosyltransferase involved in cell wall biosynthesis
MSPLIYVIVPFHRPHDAPLVLENFRRQTYPRKHLIIVENGAGIGTWQDGPGVTVLQTSPPGQSLAKNTAIDYIRRIGGTYASVFDSDDYYGPGYLAEQAQWMESYPIVGKNQHFISTDAGMFLLNPYSHSGLYDWCNGGSQTFNVHQVPYFRDQKTGEDVLFCHDTTRAGGQLYISTPYGYLYNRTGVGHTYEEDVIERAHHWNLIVVPMGPVDLEIVNGNRRLNIPPRYQ